MRSRPRQSAPSAACSSLRPASSRMEVSDSHSVNAGWDTGGRVPSYVTDNETDTVSVGQGKVLFDG